MMERTTVVPIVISVAVSGVMVLFSLYKTYYVHLRVQELEEIIDMAVQRDINEKFNEIVEDLEED